MTALVEFVPHCRAFEMFTLHDGLRIPTTPSAEMIIFSADNSSILDQSRHALSVKTAKEPLPYLVAPKNLSAMAVLSFHLELGEPDFHPAAPVVDALRDAVASGRDRISTRGIALCAAAMPLLERTRRLEVHRWKRSW